MEEVSERPAAPVRVPRVIMTTSTALSDRFRQMPKANPSNFSVFGATRAPMPEFDLEHANRLEVDEDILAPPQQRQQPQPMRHITTTGTNLMSASRAATAQEMVVLQLQAQAQAAKARNRQNLQTQRIIAQARLAAQAEIAAVLNQPGFLGQNETLGFGFPSTQVQLGGFPGYGRGFPGYGGSSFLNYRNQTFGNSPDVARALAQAPGQILTSGRGGRVGGGAPRGNFNQGFNNVRKATGSIIKTSTGLPGRGRGTPFGNISTRFSKTGQVINSPSQGQNKNRKRGNAVGVMAGVSGAGPVKREAPTKEQLDDEMDEYMSKCKSSKCLDKELDSYMKAAKAKAQAAAAQLAAEKETTKQEPTDTDTKVKIEDAEQVPIDIDVEETILADEDSGSGSTMVDQ